MISRDSWGHSYSIARGESHGSKEYAKNVFIIKHESQLEIDGRYLYASFSTS